VKQGAGGRRAYPIREHKGVEAKGGPPDPRGGGQTSQILDEKGPGKGISWMGRRGKKAPTAPIRLKGKTTGGKTEKKGLRKALIVPGPQTLKKTGQEKSLRE